MVMMNLALIFLFVIFYSLSEYRAEQPSMGSVELDEYTFDKVISKFDAALVKFDVSFPYGEKEDVYSTLARDAKDVDELLVACVGVKDYGDKDNLVLAKKYGAKKENFPVVKLFVKGRAEPITFDDKFEPNELRQFIRENTGLYVSLPGCDKKLDQLAVKFVSSDKDGMKKIIKEAETLIQKYSEEKLITGKVYKTTMEKILEKGLDFIETENQRLQKILNGKITKEKKQEILTRLNILQAFKLNKPKLSQKDTKGDSKVNKEL